MDITFRHPLLPIILRGYNGKWVGYDRVCPKSTHPARWITVRLWPVWIRWFPNRIGKRFWLRRNGDEGTLLDMSIGPLSVGIHKKWGWACHTEAQ